jgi:large exoprotein involved in heme utilization and adhesion
MPTLQNANCLSRLTSEIRAAGFVDGGVGFQSQALETPPSTLEYIGIIATNDFFVNVEGTNNLTPKGVSGKLYGYRAVASADIYAALVQSEVLSA